jgi:glycosyltransferase involved in cell wall biosynthesis
VVTRTRAALDVAYRHPAARVLSDLADCCLRATVRNASVVVYVPDAEGFGLPVVEAAAMGIPVVCTPVPAVTELPVAGVTVIRSPPTPTAISRAVREVLGRGPGAVSAVVAGQSAASPVATWADAASQLIKLLDAAAR